MPRVDAGAGNKIVVTTTTSTSLTINGTSSEIVIGDRLLTVILNGNAEYTDDAVLAVITSVASSNNQNMTATYATLPTGVYDFLVFKLRGNLYAEVTVSQLTV
jgi:hypothetical protein